MKINGYILTAKLISVRKEIVLTATEQALFHELVLKCNERGWESSFSISNGELCSTLHISENTLNTSRLKLIEAGLISYRSGKSKRVFGSYSFVVSDKITSVSTSNIESNTDTEIDTNTSICKDEKSKKNKSTSALVSVSTSNIEANTSDYNKVKEKLKENRDTISLETEDVSEEDKEVFTKLIEWLKKEAPRVLEMEEPLTASQLVKLRKNFDKDSMFEMFVTMHNYKPLLEKNVSAYKTFIKWSIRERQRQKGTTR